VTSTQGVKAPSACKTPQMVFILESLKHVVQARFGTLKDACISMFPNDPSTQHNQWIETFPFVFLDLFGTLPPPI